MDNYRSLGKFYLVANQPIFSDLTELDKTFIASKTQLVEYNKGEIIYKKGQSNRYFYIVVSGIVQTYIPLDSEEPVMQNVEYLRKGDCFGIVSLLTHQPHTLTARSMTDVRLLRIDDASFETILEKLPELSIKISRILSKRLLSIRDGVQAIFESNIISFCNFSNEQSQTNFLSNLADAIISITKKKCIVASIDKNEIAISPNIKYISFTNEAHFTEVLNSLQYEYHYILLDLPKEYTDSVNISFSKSDSLYVLLDKTESKDIFLKFKSEILEKHKIPSSSIKGCILPNFIDDSISNKYIQRLAREISGSRIGIALGGGAALGLAQIGLIKVLERENIPIDMIAGTSIGALIGSLWASGLQAKEIEEVSSSFDSFYKMLSLIDLTFPRKGLMTGQKIKEFLSEKMKDINFEDTEIPFRAVACDITKRSEIIISTGKVADGVLASISIPGMFTPIHKENGQLYVDGGVVNPMPVSVLNAEGIQRIIAVNSMPSPQTDSMATNKNTSLIDIILNSLYSLQYRIAKYSAQQADVYMNPIMPGSTWYEFYRAKEFIEYGEKEAELILPEIKDLIMN